MSETQRTPQEAREHLWKLVRGTRLGMFVSHEKRDDVHRLRSRPLTTQNRKDDRGETLYFFVPADGEVAREVEAEPSCAVAYASTDDDSYVSISGAGRVVQDTALAKAMWTKAAEAWFPGGADDPSLRVLELRIDEAEYWDVDTTKMVQLFKIATAAVTGKPPKMGEHAKVK